MNQDDDWLFAWAQDAHYRRGDLYEKPLEEHVRTATEVDRFLTQFEFHQQIPDVILRGDKSEPKEKPKPRPKWTK